MFEEIFSSRKPNQAKLEQYGFRKEDDGYRFSYRIDDQFELRVFVSASISYQVIDLETGDRVSTVFNPSARGEFIGTLRDKVRLRLEQIAEACFEKEGFEDDLFEVAKAYCKDMWDEEPDAPFHDYPNAYVIRDKETRKWYVLFMDAPGKYFSLAKERVNVCNVRVEKDQAERYWDYKKYFPCYHMNRKSWITILLEKEDGESLCERLRLSRELVREKVKGKKK